MAFNFEVRYEELQHEASRVNTLGEIYTKVEREMQWNAMDWHDADEEHGGETWFTEPEADSYKYTAYMAYQEVLDAIVKLAK